MVASTSLGRNVQLTPAQIESFVELGHCKLAGVFDAEMAAEARAVIWQRMADKRGIRVDDPTTWPDIYNIEEHVDTPEVLACFTEKLALACEELLGTARWRGARRWGLWPVNFHVGRGQPYALPVEGWHIDGNWFRHFLDTPKQGLLLIGLFTRIEPRGGGTLLAQGSHKLTARALARHPEGLSHRELFVEVLKDPIGDVIEATGEVGDVWIAHPFLFHTRSMNHRGVPRFMSNTEAGLDEPLQLERANGAYSVLERSIRQALAEPPRPPRDGFLAKF